MYNRNYLLMPVCQCSPPQGITHLFFITSNSSQRHAPLATLLLEDNQDLLYDVLCSKDIFEREFELPITFLNEDKLDAILEALPFKDQASLSIIYELLYSTVRSKVCEKNGQEVL